MFLVIVKNCVTNSVVLDQTSEDKEREAPERSAEETEGCREQEAPSKCQVSCSRSPILVLL